MKSFRNVLLQNVNTLQLLAFLVFARKIFNVNSDYINEVMRSNNWFTAMSILSNSDHICFSYTVNYVNNIIINQALGMVITNVFSIIVLLINTIIQYIIDWIIHFERHSLISHEIGSTSIKIFLAQFFNTAIIILLTRSKGYPGGVEFPIKGIGITKYSCT